MAVDNSGYTGIFHRNHDLKNIAPYTLGDLARLINKDNKLVEIMRRIKEIDKEHNGYVTSTELDDILRISYKKELEGKNVKAIFRPYSSIQNKILIDYKKFRDYLVDKLKKLKSIDIEKDKEQKLSML